MRGSEIGPGERVVRDPGEGDDGGVGVALEGETEGIYTVRCLLKLIFFEGEGERDEPTCSDWRVWVLGSMW